MPPVFVPFEKLVFIPSNASQPGPRGAAGAPGGNVMAVGLLIALAAVNIPVGTDIVQTSGYSSAGKGHALYVADAAVDAAYAAAHPRAAFVSANGRGFRLSLHQFLNIFMFGAAANYAGGGGTDDLPAINAAAAYLSANAVAGFVNGTIYRGGFGVHVPAGRYWINGTVEPLISLKLYGDGGKSWSAATQFYFPSNVTAFRSQSNRTSGDSTVDGADHFTGDQIVIQDIAFLAPGFNGSAVTNGNYHGFHCKRPVTLIRCTASGFQGHGPLYRRHWHRWDCRRGAR
jgi:hypothetical protein